MDPVTGYINGKWIDSDTHIYRYNPANTSEIAYEYRCSGIKQANAGMKAASVAFRSWRKVDRMKRKKYICEWIDRIELEMDCFVKTITLENGKTLVESGDEVRSALKDARYLIAQFERESEAKWLGENSSQIASGVYYEPVGVFLLLTPWNFPLSTLLRKMVPALLFGNTVVVKPSEFASATAYLAFRLLDDQQQLPNGSANLVIGEGSVVGPPLVKNESLRGISLTGSTSTGKQLQKMIAGRNIRFQMEMGGKNAIVVLKDADLDLAVEDTVKAAFSCAGQWCTGTSRVIIQQEILSKYSDLLIESVNKIKVGPGHLDWVEMGPVAHKAHYQYVINSIASAREEGGKVLTGGEAIPSVGGYHGWFIEPTVVANITQGMELFQKEVFGPVLSLTVATDASDAMDKVNDSNYGLAFSIYTKDLQKGKKFIEEVEAGICHLNLHTAYRHPALPISGWKDSGRGIPECGTYEKDFFTRPKAVYCRMPTEFRRR